MSTSLHRLLQSLDHRRRALLDGLDSLSPEVLQAKPRPEAWSILEIVEHLVLAEEVILQGLPARARLAARPRSLKHRCIYHFVMLILRSGIPVKVPSRRMIPTGTLSLVELRQAWDEHVCWLRAFESGPEADVQSKALFTHPVAGPITLIQALRMDLLHLQTHARQIAKLRQPETRQKA